MLVSTCEKRIGSRSAVRVTGAGSKVKGDALLIERDHVMRLDIAQEFVDLHGLEIHREFACIGERQGPQVVDELFEPFGFFADDLEIFLGGRQYAIVHGFGMTDDQAERRAQFVRDIGGHLFAQVEGAAKVIVHLVEGGCQFANFVV